MHLFNCFIFFLKDDEVYNTQSDDSSPRSNDDEGRTSNDESDKNKLNKKSVADNLLDENNHFVNYYYESDEVIFNFGIILIIHNFSFFRCKQVMYKIKIKFLKILGLKLKNRIKL